MEQMVMALTKWSGLVMLCTQGILCLGNLYLGRFPQVLYWCGGVMLTAGILLTSNK